MPKLQAGVASATSYFNLDNLDYAKNNHLVVYNNVEVSASGTVDQTSLRVGIQNKFNGRYLVIPTHFSNWTDSTDTAFASLNLLLVAFETFLVI